MDFYILTIPRSGSHMLASALDSHPEISCRGEFEKETMYPWLGSADKRVNGQIISPYRLFGGVGSQTKMICLTRDYHDIAESSCKACNPLHHFEPAVVKRQSVQISPEVYTRYQNAQADLLKAVKRFPHIVVDYNEITNGEDTRLIPERTGRLLCDFLCVTYSVMSPRVYKPKVAA